MSINTKSPYTVFSNVIGYIIADVITYYSSSVVIESRHWELPCKLFHFLLELGQSLLSCLVLTDVLLKGLQIDEGGRRLQ